MRPMRLAIVIVIICLVSLYVRAQAVSPATSVQQPDVPEGTQLWSGNLGNEPVGPGDLVYISVTGSPELSRSYRVADDGSLSLPMLKESVPVRGLVPSAIARAVSEALIREKLFVAPIVSTSVLEYRSRRVTVVGAVKSPTIIQATGELKLLNAIARAQGFAPEAGPEVIVSRPASGTSAARIVSPRLWFAGSRTWLKIA